MDPPGLPSSGTVCGAQLMITGHRCIEVWEEGLV